MDPLSTEVTNSRKRKDDRKHRSALTEGDNVTHLIAYPNINHIFMLHILLYTQPCGALPLTPKVQRASEEALQGLRHLPDAPGGPWIQNSHHTRYLQWRSPIIWNIYRH